MLAREALVARQPIFDRTHGLVAYELLFRSGVENRADIASSEGATAAVSVQSVLDIGLDDLVGSVRAWINVPRGTLLAEHYRFLPPDRVVVEILEDVEADPEVLDAIRRARADGYQVALDDFELNERTTALVELADYVKLDVFDRDSADIVAAHAAVRRPGLKVLAEKVETRAVRDVAHAAGFDLFQGYWFARPDIRRARVVPTNRNALLRLLGEVQDPATTIERIEALVAADVGLSVRLVRYVNATVFGVRARIESVRHAIVMLGLDRVRQCVTTLLLSGLEGKPYQLVTTALVRARLCEKLGQTRGLPSHQCFSAGLLSLIDAFLDQSLEDLVARLGLSDELGEALLRRAGPLGATLRAVEACERADWRALEDGGWDTASVRACYLDALSWARQIESSLVAA